MKVRVSSKGGGGWQFFAGDSYSLLLIRRLLTNRCAITPAKVMHIPRITLKLNEIKGGFGDQ